MLETLLHAVLRLFAFLLHGLLEWWSWGGETETEQWFFYCTACVAVPILSLGLLRVERYDNSQLLDWRTISTDSAEVVGQNALVDSGFAASGRDVVVFRRQNIALRRQKAACT